MAIVVCDFCGKRKEKSDTEVKRTNHNFCSRRCYENFFKKATAFVRHHLLYFSIFPGKKKIIEVFGEAYHDPEKAYVAISWKQTEFGRKAIFSQLGYDTLIVWDVELKSMSEEELAKKIKDFHEGVK